MFSKEDYSKLQETGELLKAVIHPIRYAMLVILSNGGLNVTQLSIKVGKTQSVTSQHLIILRAVGIVTYVRESKNVYYYISAEKFDEIRALAKKLRNEKE